MEKRSFVFGKENFIILGISILLVIIGFLLMSGGKTTEETGFDPSIFSARRIVIAPIVIMTGFVLVVFAILKKPKDEKKQTLEKQ
jgi:membrane-bound ClpP family serine protease